jgi:hypothetical protein
MVVFEVTGEQGHNTRTSNGAVCNKEAGYHADLKKITFTEIR